VDEDAVLYKITRLLEQGCTMLATHHDCGAPLFRCKGEIVCPVCSFPEPPAASNEHLSASTPAPDSPRTVRSPSHLRSAEVAEEPSGRAGDEQWPDLAARLRSSLLRRLQELAPAIETEQDLERLRRELDCVEGLLRAFKALQQ